MFSRCRSTKVRLVVVLAALVCTAIQVDRLNGQATTTASIFQGTYMGGFWGRLAGIGPYGGDIGAAVDSSGKMKITLPGSGMGIVNSKGGFEASGKLKVQGVQLDIAYTGTFTAIKNPSTSAILAIDGKGTWKVTTPGVNANGKWLVQRTSTVP